MAGLPSPPTLAHLGDGSPTSGAGASSSPSRFLRRRGPRVSRASLSPPSSAADLPASSTDGLARPPIAHRESADGSKPGRFGLGRMRSRPMLGEPLSPTSDSFVVPESPRTPTAVAGPGPSSVSQYLAASTRSLPGASPIARVGDQLASETFLPRRISGWLSSAFNKDSSPNGQGRPVSPGPARESSPTPDSSRSMPASSPRQAPKALGALDRMLGKVRRRCPQAQLRCRRSTICSTRTATSTSVPTTSGSPASRTRAGVHRAPTARRPSIRHASAGAKVDCAVTRPRRSAAAAAATCSTQ